MNEMSDREAFELNVEAFPWRSESHKEGYLNYVQHLRFRNVPVPPQIDEAVAYFIEKDQDSNEYWTELVGTQISNIQNEIRLNQEKVQGLDSQCRALLLAMEAINVTLKSTIK